MVPLTEPFELLRIAHSPNVHIEPIEDEEAIVISSKENGFIEFNLKNRKVNRSWAAVGCRELSAPAIFDRKSATYYCVMNEKELFSWKNEDSSLSQASVNLLNVNHGFSKLQLINKENISDILLFDNTGKVFLKSKLENQLLQTSYPQESKTRYIWSDIIDKNDDSHIFAVVVTEEGQKYNTSVVVLKKTEQCFDFVESHKALIDPNVRGCHVISCTLQEERLVVLWSDNTIYSYELPLLAYELQDTTPHGDALVGRVLLHTLPPEFKVSGKGLSKAKIGSINSDHLFVISKYIIKEKKQGIISVISNKFSTEQARSTFPLSSGKEKSFSKKERSSSKKEKPILSARYCNGKFFIALSNSLICIECNIFSTSLASALGKIKSSNSSNPSTHEKQSSSFLMSRTLKRPYKCLKGEEKKTKGAKKEAKYRKIIESLGDLSQTPTIEKFNQELYLFFKILHIRVKERFSGFEDELTRYHTEEPKTKKKKKEKNLLLPEQFVETVLRRCLEDDALWSGSPIRQLLELKCLSPKHCSDVIAKCFKTKSLGILKRCFNSIKGIYDKDIVKCIQYLLSQKVDAKTWKRQTIFTGGTLPDLVKIEEDSFLLLLVILNYPYNEYSMKEMLRNLSSDETREMLQILFELIARQLMKDKTVLMHSKIVDWISLIIDAKFTTIILSNELYHLINLIKNTVGNQMKYFEKLQQIEPFLMQLKGTYRLPRCRKPVGAYSIETIIL